MWNNQNDFTFSSKADCTRGHYGSGGRWFDTCSFQSVCDWPNSPLHVSHWHDHLNMFKVAFSRKHLPNSDPTIRMLHPKLIHNIPTVFFQSSVVQIWWGRANCSLSFLFLAERSGTSSTVAHLLLDWTCCVFWDALLRTLVITNSYW